MQDDDEQNIDDLYEEDFDDSDFIDDDEVLDFDDDEWDQLDEEEGASGEVTQEIASKKKFGLSFEKMVILGAVIVGGLIMTTQVILPNMEAKKAQKKAMSSNTTQGLVMGGTTDSVIFNKDENLQEEDLTLEGAVEDADKGFLYEPEILDMSQGTIDEPLTTNSIGLPDVGNDLELTEESIENEFSFDLTEEKPRQQEAPLIKEPSIIEDNIEEDTILTKVQPIVEKKDTIMRSSDANKKLDTILTKLEALDQKVNNVRDDTDAKIMALKDELKNAPVKTASVSTKSSSKPNVSTKQVSIPKKESKPKAQPVRWVLRSAQPGKAWVSKKGQSGVQAVSVGENLSGVGRITAISQVGGRWLVKGTQGTIKQ